MNLIPDFKEFLELLNKNEVEYMLVGGYAVIHYGYPRLTIDIDFWVNPTRENAGKVISAIADFGFPTDELSVEDFFKEDNVFQIGIAPYRIDILTSIEGVKFEEAYKGRELIKLDDMDVSVIGLDDLKKNKKAVGRHRDLDDLEKL